MSRGPCIEIRAHFQDSRLYLMIFSLFAECRVISVEERVSADLPSSYRAKAGEVRNMPAGLPDE